MISYQGCCVHLPPESIINMVDDSKEMCYNEFICYVAEEELAIEFPNYDWNDGKDLKLKDDWAVSFYQSKYEGYDCWYVYHSAIEYVWIGD